MNRPRLSRWGVPAATALLTWGAWGCGDLLQEPDTGFSKLPVVLEEVSGNRQTATPGAALGEPLRVRVMTDGDPATRLWVEWSVVSGSGTVDPRHTFSDAGGFAETRWTLGPTNGPQQVRAVVREGIWVSFDAVAENP